MNFLLDENWSQRPGPFLLHDYPGSSHVCLMGLDSASGVNAWKAAKNEGFVSNTRGADLEEMPLVEG